MVIYLNPLAFGLAATVPSPGPFFNTSGAPLDTFLAHLRSLETLLGGPGGLLGDTWVPFGRLGPQS